jgi:hypothetical protein
MERPMNDFTSIAPLIQGSLKQLEALLRSNGFFRSEALSPSLQGGYSSEIWLRRAGDRFLAVRIDWLGHKHLTDAHYHLEAFPMLQRFNYEHRAGKVPVQKFDPFTGRPTHVDPHARLRRDDS